jgi:hypothetical protein
MADIKKVKSKYLQKILPVPVGAFAAGTVFAVLACGATAPFWAAPAAFFFIGGSIAWGITRYKIKPNEKLMKLAEEEVQKEESDLVNRELDKFQQELYDCEPNSANLLEQLRAVHSDLMSEKWDTIVNRYSLSEILTRTGMLYEHCMNLLRNVPQIVNERNKTRSVNTRKQYASQLELISAQVKKELKILNETLVRFNKMATSKSCDVGVLAQDMNSVNEEIQQHLKIAEGAGKNRDTGLLKIEDTDNSDQSNVDRSNEKITE